MHYIGIDLAWGSRNTTAAVVLEGTGDPKEGARLVATADALLSDDDILAFVENNMNGGTGEVIVAIDAPTIVRNETGRRPCEAILSSALAKFQAGPHPANLTLLGDADGSVRGVRIAEALARHGIPQTPYLDTRERPIRACFEVFPHPAHIALFGLEKTLKYKAKPNRPLADRREVFRLYTALLLSLATADPPLLLDEPEGSVSDAWWNSDPATLIGARLKRHEDSLDALTCAYVGLFHHRWHGSDRCRIVGDMNTGYIVTPVSPQMADRLDTVTERFLLGAMESGEAVGTISSRRPSSTG